MQLVIPNPEISATAIVTEALQPIDQERKIVPLIFDIDVFCESLWPAASPEIWNKLENLREYKNRIFFRSTTDKARELFK